MEDLYNKLNNEFSKKRNSLTFNPEELEKLSYYERKTIEEKLLRLCKSGSADCFKYIPYMKYVSPEKEISLEVIDSFPIFYQASISYSLFKRTRDISYYEKMIKCANIDIKSFGLVINMCNETLDPAIKSMLSSSINAIEQSATGQFKNQCDELIRRSIKGDENTSMKPEIENQNTNLGQQAQTSQTRFDTEGIKSYTEEEYFAKLAEQKANQSKKLEDMLRAAKLVEANEENKINFKK